MTAPLEAASGQLPQQGGGDLAGTAALVTGSARGLGAAIIRRLAARGADVAIHYRTSERQAQELAAEIRQAGRQALTIRADLNTSAAARRLVQDAASGLGRLDHLLYNVGPFTTTPFTVLQEEEWDSILNLNLKSAWVMAVEAAAWLRQGGNGHIVHIGANSASIRAHSVYGLAKAALAHLTEALAVELGPDITVNCIAPGMIEGSEPDGETRQRVLRRTPLRRLVTASEVAEMCALLCCSPFASVTGRTLTMDGGRWLR